MNEILWSNGESRLVLSGINGAVLAREHCGLELLAPAERAFSLRFLQQNGDYLELDDSDFATFHFESGEAFWSDCRPVPGLRFTLKRTCAVGILRTRQGSVYRCAQHQEREFP